VRRKASDIVAGLMIGLRRCVLLLVADEGCCFVGGGGVCADARIAAAPPRGTNGIASFDSSSCSCSCFCFVW